MCGPGRMRSLESGRCGRRGYAGTAIGADHSGSPGPGSRPRRRHAGLGRLALAAAELEAAARALPRLVAPVHRRAAAQAALGVGLRDGRGGAHRTKGTARGGRLRWTPRRRGRVVRQRPAKPRTAVRVRSAPLLGSSPRGIAQLTVTHELESAAMTAAQVARFPARPARRRVELDRQRSKTLLETGQSLES